MASQKIGKQTIKFLNKPKIIGYYSIVGEKEGVGNFGKYFSEVLQDDLMGEKSYERAERKIMEKAILGAIKKSGCKPSDIDMLLSGDLLNQIISSSFAARNFDTTFVGLYGACSTMAESLAIGACMIDGGYMNKVACSTGSHFSTAEKQYRFPLELGSQRPPVSQWTVTASACTVLCNSSNTKKKGNHITMATFGKVTDYGIKDANNMGAAMAPSAMTTLVAHFEDTGKKPEDYDLIVTGDLGKLGSEILIELMDNKGYKLGKNYSDCGQMMFTANQKTFQGGSGCGCSASVLNSYIFDKLNKGDIKNVLFLATGALLSPISTLQGESIPGVSHAIVIERGE